MTDIKYLRNIAIIAHVDHGKTTLVDAMLRQSGTFRENEQVAERVMDSGDLERERGITILAKNTSLTYGDYKINIIDTPGHADFGGEVERSLKMADGVLLLVDAFEGCMPQTRFVLKKAMALGLKPVVVVNKLDRTAARPYEVVDEVLELFLSLDANEEQLDSPVVYTSARDGWATLDPEHPGKDLKQLFEMIIGHIPPPEGDREKPFLLLVSNIDYDEYTGRIAVGRVERGIIKTGAMAAVCADGKVKDTAKLSRLFGYRGLGRAPVSECGAGDIVAVSGLGNINIGETICAAEHPESLPFVEIDQPVLSMTFSVNDSPFAGREGEFVTSRHLRERLLKETESNISLKVSETNSPDSFIVSGRGELHLSVLIESMRRQGYEFQVSKPKVIMKTENGVLTEPIERLVVDVSEEFAGVVIEITGGRRGELINMSPASKGYSRLEFLIPARGLISYRGRMLTETKGTCVINHVFEEYSPFRGEIQGRKRGSLVAFETGEATTYGLFGAQERGALFIAPGVRVYQGMIIGESSRVEDITVNACKKKHVTNMRAAGTDEAQRLSPPRVMSLEGCLEFINDDELVEVTPENLRLRKKILNPDLRAKAKKH